MRYWYCTQFFIQMHHSSRTNDQSFHYWTYSIYFSIIFFSNFSVSVWLFFFLRQNWNFLNFLKICVFIFAYKSRIATGLFRLVFKNPDSPGLCQRNLYDLFWKKKNDWIISVMENLKKLSCWEEKVIWKNISKKMKYCWFKAK